MTWWLLAHRALLGGLLSVLTGFVAAIVSMPLSLPTLTGSNPFANVPLVAVLPLFLIVIQSALLAAADTPVYRVSVRETRRLDWAFSCALLALGCVGALAALIAGSQSALSAIRNLVGLSGLGWLAAPLLSYRYAAVVPGVFVFCAVLFGRLPGSDVAAVWAWPLLDDTAGAWVIPLILAVIGTMVFLRAGARASI